MITNDGKNIIAKYLLGQAPEFASHIAAGVGSRPNTTGGTPVPISATTDSLEFEAFRVPILSKGILKEDGVEKMVFKAEMPTDQRFLITELGLYPADANQLAGSYGSKNLLTFSPSEPWTHTLNGSSSAVPMINRALDIIPETLELDQGSINFVGADGTYSGVYKTKETVAFINSDADVFKYTNRKIRKESPRYLNRSMLVNGNSASMSVVGNTYTVLSNSYAIENSSVNFDLSKNLPTDKIKLAMAVVSKRESVNSFPSNGVQVKIELINNIQGLPTIAPKATLGINLSVANFTSSGSPNRYIVVTKNLSDFIVDPTFSWANINLIRMHVSAVNNGEEKFYVLLDGMRLENVSSTNPLYSLVGANIISTPDGNPIVKPENSTSYVEYKFGLGVT
jgi:hypothetical protein